MSYNNSQKIVRNRKKQLQIQKTQWSQFPDIDQVSKTNGEEWFNEIRDVLKKHNALNRFAITLLHKHFDIADDEIMLEKIDIKNKTLHMKPVKKSEYFGGRNNTPSITSMMIMDGEQIAVQGTMWTNLENQSVLKLSDSDSTCLKEIRDVLKKHNALDRFGIKLVNEPFKIGDDEMMLETTDVHERTQMIRPVKTKNFADKKNITMMITSWKMVEGTPVTMGVCGCIMASGDGNSSHTGGHYFISG